MSLEKRRQDQLKYAREMCDLSQSTNDNNHEHCIDVIHDQIRQWIQLKFTFLTEAMLELVIDNDWLFSLTPKLAPKGLLVSHALIWKYLTASSIASTRRVDLSWIGWRIRSRMASDVRVIASPTTFIDEVSADSVSSSKSRQTNRPGGPDCDEQDM
jgi:hypothetical protein